MPPILMRFLPYIAAVAIIGGVFYVHQRAYNAGQANVQAKWDKDKAEQLVSYRIQERRVAELQESLDLAKWRIERELEPKLKAANDYASRLARKLREHYAAGSAVPEAPDTPGGPDGTGGVGVDPGAVDATVAEFIGACKRDAIRLNGWREWWDAIPPEMKRSVQ